MEQLVNYIDNIFATLPRTAEAARMRQEMLDHMQEQYQTLLQEGKTHYEALGMVMSEFGSVAEIQAALAQYEGQESPVYPQESYAEDIPNGPSSALRAEYAAFRQKYSSGISCSIGLCILGFFSNIILSRWWPLRHTGWPDLIFVVCLASALGLFIYLRVQNNRYGRLLALYTSSADFIPSDSSKKARKKEVEKLQGVLMLGSVAAYMILGVFFNAWHPGWVIMPLAGLGCGIMDLLLK